MNNSSNNNRETENHRHHKTSATAISTCACEICGGIFPSEKISNQGGSGNLCPDCRAECQSCGCSD